MLTISAISPLAMVNNLNLGSADLRPSFSNRICSPISIHFGRMYAHTFCPGLFHAGYNSFCDGHGDDDGGDHNAGHLNSYQVGWLSLCMNDSPKSEHTGKYYTITVPTRLEAGRFEESDILHQCKLLWGLKLRYVDS